jgi:NAD(P)-dependent dehydrogenase (short-subunit alcohol dehydrogenase family)
MTDPSPQTDPTRTFRLDGKVALVTGASSGIGATLAEGFAQAGAAVVLGARRVERIESLAGRIRAQGGRALAVALDVTVPAQVVAALDAAEAAFGIVDVLVNNAGVAEPRTVLKTDRDALARTLDTNFVACWDLSREVARRLVATRRKGSIVNVASVLAGGAAVGYASYSASKAALVAFTRTFALELVRHGIRVNALAPGWFISEMNERFFASPEGVAYAQRIPAGRTGDLSELIAPALLLASDAGSYVNATVLPVDGGHHAALV